MKKKPYYNFAKFERTHSRSDRKISITASKTIGFPAGFWNDHKLGRYKYVILYFDEKRRSIGIQFSNDDKELHKFKLIQSTSGYGGNIVPLSFWKAYNIDPKDHKGKYEWEKVATEFGLLIVIELRQF